MDELSELNTFGQEKDGIFHIFHQIQVPRVSSLLRGSLKITLTAPFSNVIYVNYADSPFQQCYLCKLR